MVTIVNNIIPIKVSVIDVSGVGEVLDTFPICQTPVTCITSVFNSGNPDMSASKYQFMRCCLVVRHLFGRSINCH